MVTAYRSDIEIQQDVMDEIDWDPEVAITDVGVEVDRGIVTLTGTVENYGTKMAAEAATFRVAGVRAVANDIILHAAWTGARNDTDIAEDIADAFERTWSIPEQQIRIKVSNGRVTLKGEVDWHFQRIAAVETARHVRGVTGVSNLMTVRPEEASTEEVREGIERALVRNAEIDAGRIRIQVDETHVTLAGTVRSVAERKLAEDAAWKSPGVTSVTNDIVVELREAPL